MLQPDELVSERERGVNTREWGNELSDWDWWDSCHDFIYTAAALSNQATDIYIRNEMATSASSPCLIWPYQIWSFYCKPTLDFSSLSFIMPRIQLHLQSVIFYPNSAALTLCLLLSLLLLYCIVIAKHMGEDKMTSFCQKENFKFSRWGWFDEALSRYANTAKDSRGTISIFLSTPLENIKNSEKN